jgi:hypothetical protein
MAYHIHRRALSGSSTVIPRYHRQRASLGSLGDDTSGAGSTTLSQPTLVDPVTLQWQGNVLAQLQAGVATLKKAELQKWLQIAATLSIPLAAAVWKMIFKKGVSESV